MADALNTRRLAHNTIEFALHDNAKCTIASQQRRCIVTAYVDFIKPWHSCQVYEISIKPWRVFCQICQQD